MSAPPELDNSPRSGWRVATRSLSHRQFRWLMGSNMAFFFAMNGQFVVRSIIAFQLTNSALALGLVNLVVAIPLLLISPFGGVIADRFERRRLIISGQVILVMSEATVFALLLANQLAFWHLLVAVFVMGCVFPLMMPARQAIVANIVGRQGLANAMTLQLGGMNATRVVAPVTAGFIVAILGAKLMYGVSVTMYAMALLAMTRIDSSPPPERPERLSVINDLLDGFRYVKGDREVRILLSLSLVPIMLAMPFQALLVVFADDVWGVGNAGLGILQAAAGIGGICGSVIVAMRGDSTHRLRFMMSSLLGFGGTLFLFALSPWFLLALPLVLLSDVFASIFNTMNSTVIQILIPDEVRGRVMSLMMMTFGLTPLGTLPVSAAAQEWGAPVAVAGASLVTIVSGVLFYVCSGALRNIDAASRGALERTPQLQPVTSGG